MCAYYNIIKIVGRSLYKQYSKHVMVRYRKVPKGKSSPIVGGNRRNENEKSIGRY